MGKRERETLITFLFTPPKSQTTTVWPGQNQEPGTHSQSPTIIREWAISAGPRGTPELAAGIRSKGKTQAQAC